MAAVPVNPSAERNSAPLAVVLSRELRADDAVLEIGSGTGQHAVYFAERLAFRHWQTSELPDRLGGIRRWLAESDNTRLAAPIELDVMAPQWPQGRYDVVFSVNTCHIMPWEAVTRMIEQAAKRLQPRGRLILYGPFRLDGRFTSPSNARFDQALRAKAAHMGLRDFAAVNAIAAVAGLYPTARYAMPANNFTFVWTRRDGTHE